MRKLAWLVTLCAAAVACVTVPREPDAVRASPPAPVDAGTLAARVTEPARLPDAPDAVCAAFYREREGALSAEEHQRVFGCPPCPCDCVNGEIRCAPCAVCQPSPVPKKQGSPKTPAR